jgi:hypothetical protein
MENYNTIKFGTNKIILTTEDEHQTFEPLRNPDYILGTNFFTYENVRYFLTKTKPKKTQ